MPFNALDVLIMGWMLGFFTAIILLAIGSCITPRRH